MLLRDESLAKQLRQTVTASGGSNAARSAGQSRMSLNASDVAKLVGSYYSAELDATYRLSAAGTTLMLDRPRVRPDSLAARNTLEFSGDVGTLRFTLGSDGRAESFVLNAGRVENVKFVRR